MSDHPQPVAAWARQVVLSQTRRLEKACRRQRRDPHNVERLHQIRTRARRLRTVLEDLQQCLPGQGAFLTNVKHLGDETGKARDAHVLLERLRKYRRNASAGERAEIDGIIQSYQKRSKRWAKAAFRATHAFDVKRDLT